MPSKLVVVTPAGREHYLELLAHHLLSQPGLHEWQLWDNCRRESDRVYLRRLAQRDPRIRVVSIPAFEGCHRSSNRFYRRCDDPRAFYIKIDDDVVYLEPGALERLRQTARAQRQAAQLLGRPVPLWWSALVVNNAICSWLLKHHAKLELPERLSCQASDPLGGACPAFALRLHERFLAQVEQGRLEPFRVPDFPVSLSRLSINCLGFWGQDVLRLGQRFCPDDADEEEWLSAVLPSLTGRHGCVVGDVLVAHFACEAQEQALLRSGLLERYYALAGRPVPDYPLQGLSLPQRLRRWLRARQRRHKAGLVAGIG
ncbi:glycosyltransferase family 2 protein [Roseateles sp. DAIF2]|uniref:hypothetical protein n=1 Tax=Roseateles sp. DAIF2 TaxID=2714952 RepID=UPI0018A32787|nr:hypothetical protein [Roseateles sp. DAIF2]QPF73657.1 glycosyltransferase family 2 protein [Roseateles sp. DAIF2]